MRVVVQFFGVLNFLTLVKDFGHFFNDNFSLLEPGILFGGLLSNNIKIMKFY